MCRGRLVEIAKAVGISRSAVVELAIANLATDVARKEAEWRGLV